MLKPAGIVPVDDSFTRWPSVKPCAVEVIVSVAASAVNVAEGSATESTSSIGARSTSVTSQTLKRTTSPETIAAGVSLSD